MLQRIEIHNIALIDKASVEFNRGLNVLTGETGAGKSILIDALNLVLGVRADRDLISVGSTKAVVEATFVDQAGVCDEILEELGVEKDEYLMLSREIFTSGRNVCRVNGSLVTNAALRRVSERLIDIHGQHEHQSLFNTQLHIELLDAFGGAEIAVVKAKMQEDLAELRRCIHELANFGADGGERDRRLDILRYQLHEIQNAQLQTDEDNKLQRQRILINNAKRIVETFANVESNLHGTNQGGALDSLRICCHELRSIASLDESYRELAQQFDDAYFSLEGAADTFGQINDLLEFDANEAEEIGRRLDEIQTLKRKYGGNIEAVIQMGQTVEAEILRLTNAQALIEKLEAQKVEQIERVYQQSLTLHRMRKKVAEQFEERIMDELRDLGMNSVRFAASFADIPQSAQTDARQYTRNGLDSVEFMLSANVGQPLRPLSRIASGGEASRIMLALKNIAAQLDDIDCLIFDEIDAGIGGQMAHVVAQKMAAISHNRQVLCVTHLAQLASMADTHFLVEKHTKQTNTSTTLQRLDEEMHALEVARLLGGEGEGGHGLAHAKEMISRAKAIKQTLS